MTLSAVIIILREVLEAALVLSLLFSTIRLKGLSLRGIAAGFGLGLAGAVSATLLVDAITESLDGVGQEVFNACLLGAIALLVIVYGAALQRRAAPGSGPGSLLVAVSGMIVALAITREGMEIIIFFYGFGADPAQLLSALVGGAMGAGIGTSLGVLIYYGLINLPPRYRLPVPSLLLALVASGMVSQAVVYLMQGGFLESTLPVWDSSGWVAETSVTGQLLYALLGYEATPTQLQVAFYATTLVVFLLAVVIVRRLDAAPAAGGNAG